MKELIIIKLGFYLNSFPERKIAFNVIRRFCWLRINPGSILVYLAINNNIIIIAYSFPCAGILVAFWAFSKIVHINGIRRKIMVVFHNFSIAAFRNHLFVPYCFCHFAI